MFHLDNTSAVPEMPEPKEPQSNTPRWFGESQQQGGISWPGADWFNIVQAELLNILKIGGIEPDKENHEQISHAVKVLASDASNLLRTDLSKKNGGILVGTPNTINDLCYIKPDYSARLKPKGALSESDNGAYDWVFDLSDMSDLVSSFPTLFRAPNDDPTGRSGAWRLNWGHSIPLAAFGFGQSDDKELNQAIYEDACTWNKGKRELLFPPGIVRVNTLQIDKAINIKGFFGATASSYGGNGSCVMVENQSSNNAAVHVFGPVVDGVQKRISGVKIRDITIIGRDLFTNAGNLPLSTFTPRTAGTGLKLEFVGGQIDIKNVFVIGFEQGVKINEVWDGSMYDIRVLYCGKHDGSIPAVWIGTDAVDNTNNMKFYSMHIEFCPYSLYVGICRNVHFYGLKVESNRADDATHWGVNISIGGFEINFTDSMFVTGHSTLQPFVLNQGLRCVFSGCQFISTNPSSSSRYPGVIWYLGNKVSNNSGNALIGCYFTTVIPSDGTTVYPVQLGNYEQMISGRITIPGSVTYSGGVFNPYTSGLVSCGYGCFINGLSVNANSTAKTGGPLIMFTASGSRATGIALTEGSSVFSLFGGNNDNQGDSNYGFRSFTNITNPDVRGYGLALINGSSLSIIGFSAFTAQVFGVMLNSGSATLTNSANLVLLSGANTVMQLNKIYTFRCVNSSGKCIQVS